MRIKVFVSSTTNDLREQREYVAKRLQELDVHVVTMGTFPSGTTPPKSESISAVAQCEILVALVAFRRGTIVEDDPERRSITQFEIDEAIKRSKKVLVFMLEDNAANREHWAVEYNELEKDPLVGEWRRLLSTRFTPKYFQHNEQPDVIPAVHNQLVKWANRKTRRFAWIALITIVSGMALSLAVALVSSFQAWILSSLHRHHDPVVFYGAQSGGYKTTRIFEGRDDIVSNSSFKDDIERTTTRFDMFANTFGSFREFEKSFDTAAARGATFRFVISDFFQDPKTNPNFVVFQQAVEDGPVNLEETIARGKNTINFIREFRRKHPDQVQLKFNRESILLTMWVRDSDTSSGLAHMSWHFYGKVSQSRWPAVRVSKATGGDMLRSCADQFEVIWRRAIPDNGKN